MTEYYPDWLVPLHIAKKLREIGFDSPCAFVLTNKDRLGFTTEGESNYHLFDDLDLNSNSNSSLVCVPTFEQVLDWFRDKGLVGTIEYENFIVDDKTCYYAYRITNTSGDILFYSPNYRTFETYEDAREVLINDLIKFYGKQ